MTRWRTLLVLVALLAAGPASARGKARGAGAVEYATATRAYLDVGRADGLGDNATVTLRRAGRAPMKCQVDLVSDNHASCATEGARLGDAVAFEVGALPPEPRPLPPPPPDDEVARRAATLEAVPPAPLVPYRGPVTPGQPAALTRSRGLSASLGYASWSSTGNPNVGVASVTVGIHDAELGKGVTVDVAARAERWVPDASAQRFRPNDDTRLEVWQAQINAPISRVNLEAGRVLPSSIPGATLFDGAAAGFRLSDKLELGAFGGAVPEPDTLAFTTKRATGGAFWTYEQRGTSGTGFRQEGRIAAVESPELGTRLEASLAAGAWWRSAYLSGEAHLGVGGTAQAPGALDAARIDYTQRLGPVSIGAGYRHEGLDIPGALVEVARFPGRSDAADAWLGWDVWSHLRIGASGGFSRDPASGLDRQWVGPELSVPRIWGNRFDVSGGYLEERGWIEGRSAWGQILYRAGDRFRLVTRGTWSHQVGAGADTDEVGALASAAAQLGGGFWLRASVLARTSLVGHSSAPVGVTGSATLAATY
jgi:hypothetical protein